VVPREGGGWCAAVRTPIATFIRGDCPFEAYGEKAYSSRQEPTAPHEVEGLRWGVGKMVEEATGKVADLSFWTPGHLKRTLAHPGPPPGGGPRPGFHPFHDP
jgi:hypothetical protein